MLKGGYYRSFLQCILYSLRVLWWGEGAWSLHISRKRKERWALNQRKILSPQFRDCAVSCLNEFSCPILAGLWLGEGLVEYISGTLMQLGWFIYYKNLLFFLTTFALVTWLWCEHLIPPYPPPLYPITLSGAQIPGNFLASLFLRETGRSSHISRKGLVLLAEAEIIPRQHISHGVRHRCALIHCPKTSQ